MSALVVDRKGLARKLRNKPKAFVLYELLQNAWDEDVRKVKVTAEALPREPVVRISVEDDSPDGFQDLSSVYTLFKDSKKAADATKRGRFELGEKLVLALALRATVVSTKGTIKIEGDERSHSRHCRPEGTLFEGDFRMSRADFQELCDSAKRLIPPVGIETTFNGELLQAREPLHSFETTLPNALHGRIDKEDAASPWVTEALTDDRVNAEATSKVLDHRFGEKRVIYDPSDPEGSKLAMSEGYVVIPGGALPKRAWETVRKFGSARPAGQVTPSPKPYSAGGDPEKVIPEDRWTPDMKRMADLSAVLFRELTGRSLSVRIVREPHVYWAATFSPGSLCLNHGKLGAGWFARKKRDPVVLSLLIHEFGHQFSSDHLSEAYHKALCKLGADLTELALSQPDVFDD